jgi:hypothetical protein
MLTGRFSYPVFPSRAGIWNEKISKSRTVWDEMRPGCRVISRQIDKTGRRVERLGPITMGHARLIELFEEIGGCPTSILIGQICMELARVDSGELEGGQFLQLPPSRLRVGLVL